MVTALIDWAREWRLITIRIPVAHVPLSESRRQVCLARSSSDTIHLFLTSSLFVFVSAPREVACCFLAAELHRGGRTPGQLLEALNHEHRRRTEHRAPSTEHLHQHAVYQSDVRIPTFCTICVSLSLNNWSLTRRAWLRDDESVFPLEDDVRAQTGEVWETGGGGSYNTGTCRTE